MNEIGPENKISRSEAAGWCYCGCCGGYYDSKGYRVECAKPNPSGFRPERWTKPLHRLHGRKGRTLRSHRTAS